MLAARQHPAMGSFPSEADNLPFGYDFDDSQLLSAEHALSFGSIEITDAGHPGIPPAPATNNPLLGENDALGLNNFFSLFNENRHLDEEGVYQFSEEWKDIPPDLIGSATSFGQRPSRMQPIQHLPSPFLSQGLLDHGLFPTTSSPVHTTIPPIPIHVSPEVVAAETLLRTVHPQRPATHHHAPAFNHLGPSPLELQHADTLTSPASEFPGDNNRTLSSLVFGQPSRPVALRRTDLPAFQFGSDSNFMPNRAFIPPSHRETTEALEHQKLRTLECLQMSHSRETTRPPSPSTGQKEISNNQANFAADTGELPRKRRKSSHIKEENDEESDTPHPSASTAQRRRRKSSIDNAGLSPVSASVAKKSRRKSTANGAKAVRENLTEEQKRANHIQSEQKRRKIIKDGFEDLIAICPPLRGKSYSKSTMLTMAADWIEKLVATNKELRRQAEGVASARDGQ